jgi:hypothetical protein
MLSGGTSMFRKLIVCTAFTTIASTAHAQLVTGPTKPLSFGVAAGAAVPTSDLSDFTNTGYNTTAMLGLNTPSLPFNFRIDGTYNNFGDKYDNGSLHSTSMTGNLVFTLPTPSTVHPYLIGGIGVYGIGISDSQDGYSSGTSTDFGFNVGGGVAIPLSGFNAFIEARYNRISTGNGGSLQFVPVVFGVMF